MLALYYAGSLALRAKLRVGIIYHVRGENYVSDKKYTIYKIGYKNGF